jgi:hypothetical protein
MAEDGITGEHLYPHPLHDDMLRPAQIRSTETQTTERQQLREVKHAQHEPVGSAEEPPSRKRRRAGSIPVNYAALDVQLQLETENRGVVSSTHPQEQP